MLFYERVTLRGSVPHAHTDTTELTITELDKMHRKDAQTKYLSHLSHYIQQGRREARGRESDRRGALVKDRARVAVMGSLEERLAAALAAGGVAAGSAGPATAPATRTRRGRPGRSRGRAWCSPKLIQVRSARDRTIRTFHVRVRSKFLESKFCQNSVHFARKF